MFGFAQYRFLYLLLLVPLFLVGYGVWRTLRTRRLRKFGDEALVKALMPSWSGPKGWVKMVLFSLAFAFFAIGLARPQIGAKLSPNRLDRAKLAISRLTDKLKDDRIGLIIFAGTSFVQLPVTTDYVSAKMFLGSIDTGSVPVQGTAIGDAIYTAIKSFSAQSEKSRVIVVISDGENHEDDPVAAAKEAAENGIRVYTVGVGSAEGQPIPYEGSLMKDKDGEIVVTKLDEDVLRQVAKAGNGAYVHAGNDEFGLNPIIDDIRRMEDEELGSLVFEEYDEQYMYFFGIALALLVIEMLVGERRPKKKWFDQ